MDTVLICEATKEDAQEMMDYMNYVAGQSDNLTFGKDEGPHNLLEEMDFIDQFQKQDHSCLLIGVVDESIVSIASISGNDNRRLAHHASLGISVLKEYWSRGIASAMMEELIDFAKNHGIEVINLEVRQDNERAICLYKKFGFEQIGIYKKYLKIDNQYFDCLLMNLYLK